MRAVSKAVKKIKSNKKMSGEALKELRIAMELSQTVFWGAIMVSRSAGAKYEQGNAIPPRVQVLVRALYFNQPLHEALSVFKAKEVMKVSQQMVETFAAHRMTYLKLQDEFQIFPPTIGEAALMKKKVAAFA